MVDIRKFVGQRGGVDTAAVEHEHPRLRAARLEVALADQLSPLQAQPQVVALLTKREERQEKAYARRLRTAKRRGRFRAEVARLREQRRAEKDQWRRERAERKRLLVTSDAYRRTVTVERAEKTATFLIGLVGLAMFWSAVNVQHNLMPHSSWRDPLWWLSFGAELIVSGFVVALMTVTRTATMWGIALERKTVAIFEGALVATTISLNAGRYIAQGDWGQAGLHSVVPVMVGIGLWLHGWISARYAMILEHADSLVEDDANGASRSAVQRVSTRAGEIEAGQHEGEWTTARLGEGSDQLSVPATEVDIAELAARIVSEALPTDAPAGEYERVVGSVERILQAAEGGLSREEIARTLRMPESAVAEVLSWASAMLTPIEQQLTAPTDISDGRWRSSEMEPVPVSAQAS